METKYYSIKEAAKELGLSAAWVYRLKDLNRINAERIGAQWVITQEEIERYKTNHNKEESK